MEKLQSGKGFYGKQINLYKEKLFLLFTVKIDRLQMFLSFLSNNNQLKKLNKIKNKSMTDIVMITKVIHPTKFENSPLVLSLSIFLSLPIFMIIKIIGIAMIPLITEAYISA